MTLRFTLCALRVGPLRIPLPGLAVETKSTVA
jgi:hypothetical protein